MNDTHILTLALVSTIPIYYLLKPLVSRSHIPYVSGGSWLVGHTIALYDNPAEFMKSCREKYGSLYTIKYLGKDVIIFGKEWIYEFMKNKNLESMSARNEAFLIHEIMGIVEPLKDPKMDPAKIIRSKITPYFKTIYPRILENVKSVNGEIFDSKDSITMDNPSEFIRRMVIKSACSVFIGNRLSEDEEIIEAFYEYPLKVENSVVSKVKYIIFPVIGRWLASYLINKEKVYLPYLELFTDKITKEINMRKKQEKSENYERPIDMLQELIDDNFTIEEIGIICLSLIFASVNSTTANATMALYDIVTYPKYLIELYEEQQQIQKEYGKELNLQNLSKMSMLNSFIRETMRFRLRGVDNYRLTTSDWTLSNGITIPKGSLLAIDTFSLAYDDNLQGGDAYEYKPFRHALSGKSVTKVEPQNLSFGIGQNACPGRFLSTNIMMTILAFVLRNYKINTLNEKPHPYIVKAPQFGLPKGEPLIFTKIPS